MQNGLKVVGLGVATFSNIDLTIEPGRCVGLTGPSGTGKSLILRALADLDPHEGTVWFDGAAANQVSPPQWRCQVGLLPAESAWWHDTVGPHFEKPPMEWLADLGFAADVLEWKISRLSSGERQRLALLRLLVRYPRVLLLDEPTANLDRQNIDRVESLLQQYRRSRNPTIIWVSHDLDQLRRNCDPIYGIEGRRIVRLQPQNTVKKGEGA